MLLESILMAGWNNAQRSHSLSLVVCEQNFWLRDASTSIMEIWMDGLFFSLAPNHFLSIKHDVDCQTIILCNFILAIVSYSNRTKDIAMSFAQLEIFI